MHETAEEAQAETVRMLNIYADFCENELAIPVIKGQKTESEKFAGAEATYTIEAMMHDGKALQSGTSHYFGDGFAKAFGIQFTDRENKLQYPHQTSWGVSTRLIGAIIMAHGDDNGLVLPPAIAPIQVVIVPIAAHKPGVLEKAAELEASLGERFRVKTDRSEQSPGWKFAEYEMKGVPLRLELGPRDIEKGQCVLVRRDNREKIPCALSDAAEAIEKALEDIRASLYNMALSRRSRMTYDCTDMDNLITTAATKPGFIRAMWCGSAACEERIKERAGVSSRCIPFDEAPIADRCVCCGEPAKHLVYWGKAY